jgi:hypothetical protein
MGGPIKVGNSVETRELTRAGGLYLTGYPVVLGKYNWISIINGEGIELERL